MEIQGEIIFIGETIQVKDTFKKREFVVKTEEQYPQEILLQFTQERCGFLNDVEVGSIVTVWYNLRGRGSQNEEGKKRWFNTLDAWKFKVTSNAEPEIEKKEKPESSLPAKPNQTEEDDLPF